ncbi:hypothetical protein [Micromonospora sp. SH-82]|uniref:hypothetical protein n=1 Tax=Micromonospora sp. SH-82 TaxID=3132938 RepID=UPI003EB78240
MATNEPPPRPSAGPPGVSSSRVAGLLSWLVPGVCAAALGGWRLTGASLWADELATWGAVRSTWVRLWELSGSVDAVLTPYYAVTKAYATVAGTGTAALRLPSVVAIVGATVVVAVLGRRLGGAGAGFTAGLVFALLPVTSRYAQEARPYAFVILASAVAVLALDRALARPTPGRLAGYAAACAAAGLLHPLSGLLLLAGHAVGAGWWCLTTAGADRSRRTGRRWLVAAGVGASPAVLLGWWGAGQTGQVSWIRPVDLDILAAVPEQLFLSAAAGGLVLGAAVTGVRRTRTAGCLAAAAFVPLVSLLVAGVRLDVWVARYVLVVLPPLAVLAGYALTRSGRRATVGVLCLLVVLVVPAQVRIRAEAGHGQASARIATVIGPRQLPGDVVVFPDTHRSIPWSARDVYERYLPAPRPPDVLRTAPPRTDGRLAAVECPDAACLGAPPRVWVVRVDSPADPLADMAAGKQDRIRREYRVVHRWREPLLGITLLERRPGMTIEN